MTRKPTELDSMNRLRVEEARKSAALKEALRELLAAEEAEYPPASAGREAQDAWSARRHEARRAARALVGPDGVAIPAPPPMKGLSPWLRSVASTMLEGEDRQTILQWSREVDTARGIPDGVTACLSPDGEPRRCVMWKCHEAKTCARGVKACGNCNGTGNRAGEKCGPCEGTGHDKHDAWCVGGERDGVCNCGADGVLASDCSRESGHHFDAGKCVYCTAPDPNGVTVVGGGEQHG